MLSLSSSSRLTNEGTQGNHLCLSLIRRTNIILTIIILSQSESTMIQQMTHHIRWTFGVCVITLIKKRKPWGHLNTYASTAAFLQHFTLILSANISIYKQYLCREIIWKIYLGHNMAIMKEKEWNSFSGLFNVSHTSQTQNCSLILDSSKVCQVLLNQSWWAGRK